MNPEKKTLVEVASKPEVVAVVKFCLAVHQLALPRLSESEVEPPRATDPPPLNPEPAETVSAPLPVKSELPIVVVEISLPF